MAYTKLHSTLSTEVIQLYARLLWIGAEKSLELVQAMITTAVWYLPIGEWSRLKFYEYVHLASTMAMDIGLGEPDPQTRRKPSATAEDSFFLGQGVTLDDTDNDHPALRAAADTSTEAVPVMGDGLITEMTQDLTDSGLPHLNLGMTGTDVNMNFSQPEWMIGIEDMHQYHNNLEYGIVTFSDHRR
ncbi:hypothetical protein MBLNU459_g4535t1 [Dothideomycetes sp. NU459]